MIKKKKKTLSCYIYYINQEIDLIFIKITDVFLSVIVFKNDENIFFNSEYHSVCELFDKSKTLFIICIEEFIIMEIKL